VGILITHLVIFHNNRPCGSRLSSMELHWSFLHSLTWLVTDLCRRVTSAFIVVSLEICHCLLNWVFRHVSSWIRASIRGHRSSSGRHLGVDSGNSVEIVLDSSLSHVSIATSFGRSGLDGSPASRQVWNLDQSVLKSGRSEGFIKDDRHLVSICVGK